MTEAAQSEATAGAARPAKTWGLDLATAQANVGLVSIVWDGGTPGTISVEEVPGARAESYFDALAELIVDSVGEGDWWAVDVPFGWPDGFGTWLSAHNQRPTPIPSAENVSAARPWDAVANRFTDCAARTYANGPRGFNVSFDKLGATAAAWSRVEVALAARWGAFDRSGRTGLPSGGRVIETWPAAAWRCWFADKDLGKLTGKSWRVPSAARSGSSTTSERSAMARAGTVAALPSARAITATR